MSRIRSIKPEFFTSEDIFNLSPLARLLFIGLWTQADREGRFLWRPATLKTRILPADNCKIEKLLEELGDRGLIGKYDVDGQAVGLVMKFHDHQHVNLREPNSKIPPPTPGTCMHVQKHSGTCTGTCGREGKGGEGIGEGKGVAESDSAKPEPSPVTVFDFPLQNGVEWGCPEPLFAELKSAFPHLDTMGEFRKARSWLVANPQRGKTANGMPKFLQLWLDRAQNDSRGKTSGRGGTVSQMRPANISPGTIESRKGTARTWPMSAVVEKPESDF